MPTRQEQNPARKQFLWTNQYSLGKDCLVVIGTYLPEQVREILHSEALAGTMTQESLTLSLEAMAEAESLISVLLNRGGIVNFDGSLIIPDIDGLKLPDSLKRDILEQHVVFLKGVSLLKIYGLDVRNINTAISGSYNLLAPSIEERLGYSLTIGKGIGFFVKRSNQPQIDTEFQDYEAADRIITALTLKLRSDWQKKTTPKGHVVLSSRNIVEKKLLEISQTHGLGEHPFPKH